MTRAAVRSRIGTGIDMSINTLISDYIGRTEKVRRTAYAEPLATVAIIVAKTCSFTVKWPGLRGIPKTVTFGMMRAHTLPTGKMSNWATSCKLMNNLGINV